MSRCGILVQLAVLPGKLEEMREVFTRFYADIRHEPGLECNYLMIDKDDPSKVFIFEVWSSKEDLEKHFTTEQWKRFSTEVAGTYGPEGSVRILAPFE